MRGSGQAMRSEPGAPWNTFWPRPRARSPPSRCISRRQAEASTRLSLDKAEANEVAREDAPQPAVCRERHLPDEMHATRSWSVGQRLTEVAWRACGVAADFEDQLPADGTPGA